MFFIFKKKYIIRSLESYISEIKPHENSTWVRIERISRKWESALTHKKSPKIQLRPNFRIILSILVSGSVILIGHINLIIKFEDLGKILIWGKNSRLVVTYVEYSRIHRTTETAFSCITIKRISKASLKGPTGIGWQVSQHLPLSICQHSVSRIGYEILRGWSSSKHIVSWRSSCTLCPISIYEYM
jgi:hypothetical protein